MHTRPVFFVQCVGTLERSGLTVEGKSIAWERGKGRTDLPMRARAAIVLAALACLAGTAASTGAQAVSDEASAAAQRRASVLRAEAEALREQANNLRDGEGATHP